MLEITTVTILFSFIESYTPIKLYKYTRLKQKGQSWILYQIYIIHYEEESYKNGEFQRV